MARLQKRNQMEIDQVSCEAAIRELEQFLMQTQAHALYKFVISKFEKPLIELVLGKSHGNKLKAAQILGINRNTLHAKIKKLGIQVQKCKD